MIKYSISKTLVYLLIFTIVSSLFAYKIATTAFEVYTDPDVMRYSERQ